MYSAPVMRCIKRHLIQYIVIIIIILLLSLGALIHLCIVSIQMRTKIVIAEVQRCTAGAESGQELITAALHTIKSKQ